MAEHLHAESLPTANPSAIGPDAVIERLAGLAEQTVSEADFYRELLSDLVAATAGLGAALWVGEEGGLRLAAQNRLAYSSEPTGDHRDRLRETLTGRRCRILPCDSDADAAEILCPCQIGRNEWAVLQLRQKTCISEAARAGQERFVAVMADLLTTFHRNHRIAAAAEREEVWRQVDRFAQAIHRPVELDATAYEIANEGRQLVDCDRLTVLIRRGKHWRTAAVSGSDTVNRRSSVIAHLESLAPLVATYQEPIWSGSRKTAAPPEVEDALSDYHDCSSARLAGFVPLSAELTESGEERTRNAEPFAVLVFERFDQVEPEEMRERCDAVCRHSATALRHSLTNHEMPLRQLSCLLDRSRWVAQVRRQPWAVLIVVAAVALLGTLGLIQAPLRIEATGTLQPRSRSYLFAPSDGVVEQLLVHEAGQAVAANEELIRLRAPQLQLEMERVLGEMETARKQLAGIEAERLHTDRTSRSDLREAAKRSAEEEALKKLIHGRERQQAILRAREDKLSVRSPMDGQILTWDVEQLLSARPVKRGQILLTVADLQGPWVLELEIPDDQVAEVTEAFQSHENSLSARFILATAPEVRYSGVLEKMALATDVRGEEGPTVSAIVVPEDQEVMRTLRPGASVIAKIDCGRSSVLYVMFRGLIRTIRTYLMF